MMEAKERERLVEAHRLAMGDKDVVVDKYRQEIQRLQDLLNKGEDEEMVGPMGDMIRTLQRELTSKGYLLAQSREVKRDLEQRLSMAEGTYIQDCVFLVPGQAKTAIEVRQAEQDPAGVTITGNVILQGSAVAPVRSLAILWFRPTLRGVFQTIWAAVTAYARKGQK